MQIQSIQCLFQRDMFGNCVDADCGVWYDGCNTCHVSHGDGQMACTEMWCEEPAPDEEVKAEEAPRRTNEGGKSVSKLSFLGVYPTDTGGRRGYYFEYGHEGRGDGTGARRGPPGDGATAHVTTTGRGGGRYVPANEAKSEADEGEDGGALTTGQQQKRRKYAQTRKCSARGCDNDVHDRFLWNEVAFCVPHRHHQEEEGVLVDGHDEPMRWCTHCKKPHNLCDFADSITGPSRKLTSCKATHATRLKRLAEKAALLREQKGTLPRRHQGTGVGGGGLERTGMKNK